MKRQSCALRCWESTNIYSSCLDALHQPFYVEFVFLLFFARELLQPFFSLEMKILEESSKTRDIFFEGFNQLEVIKDCFLRKPLTNSKGWRYFTSREGGGRVQGLKKVQGLMMQSNATQLMSILRNVHLKDQVNCCIVQTHVRNSTFKLL